MAAGSDPTPAPDPEATARVAELARTLRVVAAVLAVVWLAAVGLWEDGPFAFTFDDAYYYFEIADRIADGQGSTFDGINDTNGYHPLWMAVCTAVFATGVSGLEAVRVVLGLQVLIWFASCWVLSGTVARLAAGWPRLARRDRLAAAGVARATVVATFALITANPFVVRIAVSGLESGLVVLAGVVLADRFTVGAATVARDRDHRWRWRTGVLLAVAVLARTDHVLLVGTVAVSAWCELRGRTVGERARAVAALVVPAGATLVAYLALNQVATGSALQVSGLVKRVEPTPALAAIALVTVGAVAVVLARAAGADRAEGGRFGRLKRFRRATAPYGAFAVGLVAYYSLFQEQRWLWYYAPVLVWLIGLALVGVADMAESGIADDRRGTSARRVLLPLQSILGTVLLAGIALTTGQFTDPGLRSIQVANRDAGAWLDANLPAGSVVASWDAGALGYFTDVPVVNIDGVVNSLEFYEATEDGAEAIGAFLDRAGVTHIVNHGTPVDGEDPAIVRYGEAVFGPDRVPVLVDAFPFVYTGATVGQGGRQTGTRTLAVFVYEVPPPPA